MDLTCVSTLDLERLHAALVGQRVPFPLSRLSLLGEGLEALSELTTVLNSVGRDGCLAAVAAVIAERRRTAASPELVWTGPESRRSGARDTAVVLADLFGRATARVLLAGFVFDHAAAVLEPLHAAMARGVACRVFADAAAASAFTRDHWPFGPPFPEVYGFLPAPGTFASLHAKCVVVDGRWVLVTSANFTDRGQTRNVEVGVLLDDSNLASLLEAQFAAGDWFKRES